MKFHICQVSLYCVIQWCRLSISASLAFSRYQWFQMILGSQKDSKILTMGRWSAILPNLPSGEGCLPVTLVTISANLALSRQQWSSSKLTWSQSEPYLRSTTCRIQAIKSSNCTLKLWSQVEIFVWFDLVWKNMMIWNSPAPSSTSTFSTI